MEKKGFYKRAIVLVLILGASGYGIYYIMSSRGVTAQAWSPDGKLTAIIQERKGANRTFTVMVTNRGGSSIRVFNSPEEGPAGTERILWSSSGGVAFLVVGKNFKVDPKIMTTEGEQIYLVFDMNEKKVWCNASQVKEERITEALLRKYSFPITLVASEPVAASQPASATQPASASQPARP